MFNLDKRNRNGFGGFGLTSFNKKIFPDYLQNIKIVKFPLDDVQILTRYCSVEKPYFAAFLKHYSNLGIKSFHVLVQYIEEKNEIENHFFKKFPKLNIFIHKVSNKISPNKALENFDISIINGIQKYTLLVDCDEFLYFGNRNMNISKLFLLNTEVKQFFIPWIIMPQITSDVPNLKGFWGHIGKPIALSKSIKKLRSVHSFEIKQKNFLKKFFSPISCPVGEHGIFLVHFWPRSFRDTLLKVFGQRLRNSKSKDRSRALEIIRSGDLPIRIRIMAYLDIQYKYLRCDEVLEIEYEQKMEEQLLRKYLSEKDEKICWNNYKEYKKTLEKLIEFLPNYPNINIMELGKQLPSLKELNKIAIDKNAN